MDELQSILSASLAADADAADLVLATVVHVEKSGYRRPGARLLLSARGQRLGSVSGGCLESDLCRKAWWLTAGGRPVVRVYDTGADEDAEWGFNLGCSGVIHVLLERPGWPSTQRLLRFLAECRRGKRAAVVATVIRESADAPCRTGDRLLLTAAGVEGGELAGSDLEPAIAAYAPSVLERREGCLLRLGAVELSLEYAGIPPALLVFGAGPDAVPLAGMAARLGWRVTVADTRPGMARPERFPGAEVVLLPQHRPLSALSIDGDTAVVLMTHSYDLDGRLLPELVRARPRYLGMLGPRVRAERLRRVLGGACPPPWLHAPVGLDLGADTPEAIGLSVVAEVQAVLSGRDAGMLRDRPGAIHTPVPEVRAALVGAAGVGGSARHAALAA